MAMTWPTMLKQNEEKQKALQLPWNETASATFYFCWWE